MKTITYNFRLRIMMLVSILAVACNDPSAHLPETPKVDVLSSQSLLFAREGGTEIVKFESSRPWTAQILNTPEWVSFAPDHGEAGKHEIVITVSEQPAGANFRSAVLVINSSAAGKDIQVMQSGKPIVTTFDATGVSETSATLNGSWIYGGEDITVTEYGFALKAGDGTFARTAVEAKDESTGAFVLTIENIQPETEYTYHSYAMTSEEEEICGADITFKTPKMPVDKTIAEFKTYARENITKGKTLVLEENYIIHGTVHTSYIPAADIPSKAVFPLKETYIQITDDNKVNSGLTLYFKAAEENTYKPGDKVKIRMKDATIKHTSNGAVSAYPVISQIEVTGTENVLEAVTISHTAIADYEAMPVKIENTQLIKVHTTDGTELWKDTDLWTFEVENSDVTYQMFIYAESELAAQEKKNGSGHVSGTVITDGSDIAVQGSVVSLEGERFVSLLEPRFTSLQFDLDNLIIGIENELELSLKYENGGSKEIIGNDIQITSNIKFTAEVEETYTLKKGNGSIKIKVKVTPADYTTVTFKVSGFLEGEQSGELEVIDPIIEDKGNFEATWTIVGKNSISEGSSNNPAVSVTPIELTGTQTNYNDSNAATKFNSNDAASPTTYFETSVTVNSGTLSLYGISYMERSTDGVEVVLQYAVGSGNFVDITRYAFNAEEAVKNIDLKEINALKSLAAGTTIRFKIIPLSSDAKSKYGLRSTASPSVWGDVK